jgi:hypothetical protein
VLLIRELGLLSCPATSAATILITKAVVNVDMRAHFHFVSRFSGKQILFRKHLQVRPIFDILCRRTMNLSLLHPYWQGV